MCASVASTTSVWFYFCFNWRGTSISDGSDFFSEMDQSHIGGVINHQCSMGDNDHIMCTLCGRFTPIKKVIAQTQAQLNTGLYIDLITWFIWVSKHHAFRDVTPPEECPQPILFEDRGNEGSTDDAQNPSGGNEFGGRSFTFTSAHEPSETTGVYRNNTEFTVTILNRALPMLLAYQGKCVNSGRELWLEWVFSVQFHFGLGGSKMKRPTRISEIRCL